MIKFRCKSCEKKIAVKDEYAGKRVKCPNCAEALTIPTPPPAAAGSAVGLPGGSAAMGALAGLDMPAGGGSLRRMDPEPEAEAPVGKRPGRAAKPTPGSPGSPGPAASSGARSPTAIAPPKPTEADVKTCPKCGTAVNASAKICINCGHGFAGLSAQNRARMRFASLFMGRSGIALAGGLGTALLAGFIWAAVARYTGFQFGILASLLGAGVGLCVALIARQQNQLIGVAAAFVALLGWVAGKVMILYWAYPVIAVAEITGLAAQFGADLNEGYAEVQAIENLHTERTINDTTYEAFMNDELKPDELAKVKGLADDWIKRNGEPSMESDMVASIREEIMNQPLPGQLDEALESGVLSWLDGLWVFFMLGGAWRIGSGAGIGTEE